MANDESMAEAIIRLTSNAGSSSSSNDPKMSTRSVNDGVSFKTESVSKGLRTVHFGKGDNNKEKG